MTKRENDFASLLAKMPPERFLGVVRIMGISLIDEEQQNIKDAEDLLDEMFVKFSTYSKQRQRTLLKIMRAAEKQRNYGTCT